MSTSQVIAYSFAVIATGGPGMSPASAQTPNETEAIPSRAPENNLENSPSRHSRRTSIIVASNIFQNSSLVSPRRGSTCCCFPCYNHIAPPELTSFLHFCNVVNRKNQTSLPREALNVATSGSTQIESPAGFPIGPHFQIHRTIWKIVLQLGIPCAHR